MRAITKIIAAAIAAISIISVAGCSGGKPNARTATNANWNVRTSTSVEKNFTDRWLNFREVTEYEIGFTKGVNGTYSVNYNDGGTYKTEFGMTYFDWTSYEDMPEGYAPAENTKELVYFFNTVWEMAGTYAITSSGEKKDFTDRTETVCFYRLAGDNLQPVYSQQQIKSTAPNSLNATNIANACVEIDGVHETFYNYDCTKATILHTDNLTNNEDAIGTIVSEVSVSDKEGHSVFDNSQLRAAVRAFTLSGGSTHTFNVLVPQNGGIQPCTAVCAAPVALNKDDAEQKKIIDALDECGRNNPDYIFFEDNASEGEDARNYRFSAVSMGLKTEDPMTGSSPTLWYSTVENSEINYSKSILLRMTTPVPFGLGTINYTIKSLNLVPNA